MGVCLSVPPVFVVFVAAAAVAVVFSAPVDVASIIEADTATPADA